jgi:hypothetical protein
VRHGLFPNSKSFKCWVCRVVLYREEPVYGSLDAMHVLKRLAAALRLGSRALTIGAFSIFLSTTQVGSRRVPLAALVGTDTQSDAQGVWLHSENVVPDAWDAPGLLIYQFYCAQVIGIWTAGCLFPPAKGVEFLSIAEH